MKTYLVRKQGPIETHPLELVEKHIPIPKFGQVLIRVEDCGICHTDLHIADGDLTPPKLPITPGH